MSSVLITGASRGIGRATAIELAARGHEVIATARNTSDLDGLDVAKRLQLDVTDQASVDAAIAQAGHIDVLVANAGVAYSSSVEAIPVDDLEWVFALNVGGALRVTQALLPAMRQRQSGRIIYMSSLLGRIAVPMRIGYSASKWALEAIGETLALETAPFNIKVSLIEPGAVATEGPGAAKSTITDDDPYLASLESLKSARAVPMPAEDVAKAVADTIEHPAPPLRVPVGDGTVKAFAAHSRHPREVPFNLGEALAAGSRD